jgi:thiamine-phosphate pyrophosphorylase
VALIPRLHVVADRGVCASDDDYLAALSALGAAAAGVEAAVQVRIKSGDVTRLAAAARGVVTPPGCILLLNGGIDRALSLRFSGAHLPQAEIPTSPVSPPPGFIVGASVHDPASLAAAERARVHYVVFGPVWSPGSKVAAPVGLQALAAIVSRTRVPVVAIGGITPGRVSACLEAGAHGVAVVSGIMGRQDRVEAMCEYLDAVGTVRA